MSDLPPPPSAAPAPPPWEALAPPKHRRRWPIFTLLVITLIVALRVAIIGWFRPLPDNKPPRHQVSAANRSPMPRQKPVQPSRKSALASACKPTQMVAVIRRWHKL